VAHGNGGIEVRIDVAGQQRAVVGDVLLVATGRTPNGDRLDAHLAGVDVRGSAVVVDDAGRTSAPGVWALGDVNGRHQLKHMANGEARVVRHNLSHPDDLRHFDHRPAPHGVFTFPQIGAVGLTEAAARAQHGDAVDVVTHPYSGAAYGWALEDCDGYVKLVGDRRNRTLLGAHMIGYHAATAVQLLIQGMHLGATVDELAVGQIWIHPALPEVIEQALLKLIEAFDAR
jgi:mycothione reductase